MPLRLGTNITAINAGRNLNTNTNDFTKRVERLASGLRINRGADDAAGLSLSEGMRLELSGMREGVRNAAQGISLVQLAEGSLNETSNMLIRMRELAVTSANSTMNDKNRGSLAAEFHQLASEIDRIALSTTYNKQTLLTGFGNVVSQNSKLSTALDGFAGVSEVGISGAVPGTYVFSDTSSIDNQITLSIDLPDGTRMEQSIDVGSILDTDGAKNLVATGTTVTANFDRLGLQVTMVGAGADQGTTLRLTVPDILANAGNIILESGDALIPIAIAAGQDLAAAAAAIDTLIKTLDSEAFATFDANLGEILVETNGIVFDDPEGILGTFAANAYEGGRLDGKVIRVDSNQGGVLQVGPNDNADNRISLSIGDMRASGTTLNLAGLSVSDQESSKATITRIDSAIVAVSRQRGDLGAVQNRLDIATNNLETAIENLQAAESAIRDADVAEEMSQFTRGQILTQAATAMLAQANTLPQTALRLLQ